MRKIWKTEAEIHEALQFAVETVAGTATESARLPPPWLRGGSVVPRIKSDDPYLQIVRPDGIAEGEREGGEKGGASGTLSSATRSPHDDGADRGGLTTVQGTKGFAESASTAANLPAWFENRDEFNNRDDYNSKQH